MEKNCFRVLSVDGGGMRGLYTATLLSTLAYRFDDKFSKESPDLGKAFNLICGTSTGAILACAIAAGISLNKIRDLYIQNAQKIFRDPIPTKKWPFFGWLYKFLKRPSANADALRMALEEIFQQTTIKELYQERNVSLCIPSINASNHKAWVFKTPHNSGKHRDDNYALVDVCMASSAAPIFFPLAQIADPDDQLAQSKYKYFVDGGLWANNPLLVALTESLGMIDFQKHKIEILSVGTCDIPSGDPYSLDDPNWGIEDWKAGVNALEMSLSAQSFGYTSAAKFLALNLVKAGVEIQIIRFKQTNKSPEQYSAIGLDKGDDVAVKTLNEMAKVDADAIHSEMISNNSKEANIIKDIFTNLEILKK